MQDVRPAKAGDLIQIWDFYAERVKDEVKINYHGKFIVKKYCESVQFIEVNAESRDDAYDLAVEADRDDWSEWEPCLGSETIEYDFIEEVKNDES